MASPDSLAALSKRNEHEGAGTLHIGRTTELLPCSVHFHLDEQAQVCLAVGELSERSGIDGLSEEMGHSIEDSPLEKPRPVAGGTCIGLLPGGDDGAPGDAPLFGSDWWARLLEGWGVAPNRTRSLLEPREAAGEELNRRIDEVWNPSELKPHLTHFVIKPFTWGYDLYVDEGNLAGSLCSLGLFFAA